MELHKLSELDDYQLVYDDQDIRGWEVRDALDTKLGEVDDLLVNRSTEQVEMIRLEDGRDIPTAEINIGDGVVYATGEVKETVRVYGAVPVRERAFVGEYDTYANDFRTHCETELKGDYNNYEPAYKYGYSLATDPNFRDRDYSEVESDVQRAYSERYGDEAYAQYGGAIRHAYDRTRQSRLENA